jgi:hypothetical protein
MEVGRLTRGGRDWYARHGRPTHWIAVTVAPLRSRKSLPSTVPNPGVGDILFAG